ncbi:MAG TPA: hypothetical protein V6C46_06430 [Coleofasciculaceae cyanobacterium]
MTYPDDDRPLIDFLRHYRPPTPPASEDLEDRILAQITAANTQSTSVPLRRRQRLRYWAIPTAIAAGLVATVISQQVLTPKPPSNADQASLEAFIETSWNGTVSSDETDYDWLLSHSTSMQ